MKVWVYPEKTYEELGAVRWEVEWDVMTKGYHARVAADPNYESDMDSDFAFAYRTFKTEKSAKAFARKIVKAGDTAGGAARVQKQVVDWFVEEDRVAEWADVGETDYVD